MENQRIQSFWYSKDQTQNSLSVIELLCVASFLYHNHDFYLYTYTPNDASMQYLKEQISQCKNAQNLHIKDAREILPESEIFYDHRGVGIASFSDYFRYHMLYANGGWWVDMDTICLKPLDLSSPFVFASERRNNPIGEAITNCVIKGEKDSSFLSNLIEEAKEAVKNNDYIPNKTLLDKLLKALKLRRKRKVKTVNWGLIGPDFLNSLIKNTQMEQFVVPPNYFCEIDWFNAKAFIDPTYKLPQDNNMYILHAWNGIWEKTKQEKTLEYPKNCLLERLKEKYLLPPPLD